MSAHTLPHDLDRSGPGRWIAAGAVSGAIAVVVFHQAVAALLHAAGLTQRIPYSMQPTSPLGIGQVWSLVFWGAVWGIALAAALRRFAGARLILAASVFGAILPTLVAWTLVAWLKGQPLFAGGVPASMAVGVLVNAAWGLGTGIGLALLARRH